MNAYFTFKLWAMIIGFIVFGVVVVSYAIYLLTQDLRDKHRIEKARRHHD